MLGDFFGFINGVLSIPVGLFLGVIFFGIWRFTRKHVVSISSVGGSSLNFEVQGMDDDKIADFVYKVSLAKQTRVNQIVKL